MTLGFRVFRRAVGLYVGGLMALAVLLAWTAWQAHLADETHLAGLLALAALATGATAAAPALAMAFLWRRPVLEIIRAARALSSGDIGERISIASSDELAELADAVNQMRDRLLAQISTIDRQRRNLEMLVGGLEEGVIVADASGRVVLSNRAIRRMLGSASGAGGDSDRHVVSPVGQAARPAARRPGEVLPPSDLTDPWRGQLMEAVISQHELQKMLLIEPAPPRANQPLGESEAIVRPRPVVERTVEVETAEGRRLTLRARSADLPLISDQPLAPGTPSPRMLVLSDVSELTASLRIKTDFVANASHELRNPLNILHMALENLLSMDRVAEAPTAERFLNVALGHCRRLEALVRDLLDLSKLENPAVRFRSERIDLAGFVAELHTRHTGRLTAKSLTWRLEGFDTPRTLVANPHLLGLVFNNLVDNAIKFTPPGGSVTLKAQEANGRIDIAIADTGTGIPQADQGRVFERFYQVDRARSGPERGTGLGLSIVKHAVAALDGSVRLESALGRGTTVTVNLPLPEAATA